MKHPVESLLAAKLLWARDDGCPIAPSNQELADEMAASARRRWASFQRRHKTTDDTIVNRVNDLARGLGAKFDRGEWPMVGALITDYTWLAEQLAPILADDTDTAK